MKPSLLSLLTLLGLAASTANGQIVDDFVEGWRQSSSTPGEMSTHPGKLHMKDARGEPDWMTVSKTFEVDFEKTPVFLVQVADVSSAGTVKLIRQEPFDKRTALRINGPGLYAVDMRSQFGWKGTGKVEVCLYVDDDEEEITYGYVKFTGKLTAEEESLRTRTVAQDSSRLHVEAFEVAATFASCSYYLPGPRPETFSVTFRQQEGTWLEALEPPYVAEDNMLRGSIVGLEENTPYEIRITGEQGKVLAQEEFRTWQSEVPIAKTVVLDETNFKGRLAIRDQGSPDGWIKYTARKGFVLKNDRTGPLLELEKARYVILEGLTLRGGLQQAIAIKRCEHVRVVNCDVAGWGRIGRQRFDLDGKYYTERGAAINWDTAILVEKSLGTVVERCYIHDPVNTANPWYYSHPAGPQAVGIDKPRSTVIRYNDFIGSDLHRWNDGIEGTGNFDVDGGFNRDADVYGNLICFANDDAVEIDGGQINVRVFGNQFEGCLCGVSIQGCMSGPSYVFRNLLVNMADENGIGGQTIKTSTHANGLSAVSFIFNNTCYGGSSDLSIPYNLRIVARNNIFAGRSAVSGRQQSPQSESDYNLLPSGKEGDEKHGFVAPPGLVEPAAGLYGLTETSAAIGRGTAIANFAEGEKGRVDLGAIPRGSDAVLPLRPIPVAIDRGQLMFSRQQSASGASLPVTAAVAGEGFASEYTIAQNEAFDWFRVSPATGTLRSGQKAEFTVTLIPDRMRER
ncbi:MAG: right-handed parallel beta-helix repeat-containing protein, partial [Thermoguttaceae bacterium]